jgi:hypothetical protein
VPSKDGINVAHVKVRGSLIRGKTTPERLGDDSFPFESPALEHERLSLIGHEATRPQRTAAGNPGAVAGNRSRLVLRLGDRGANR